MHLLKVVIILKLQNYKVNRKLADSLLEFYRIRKCLILGSTLSVFVFVSFFIPLREVSEPCPEWGGGPEAEVALQRCGVGVRHRHVPGLHRDKLPVCLEVVVLRKHSGPDKLLLKHRHEVQQALGRAVADVVDHVRRHGEPVLPGASLGSVAHDPDHTLHDVVDVCEVPEAVAVVEYFYLLALDQPVCEAVVGHVGPAAGSVDCEEAQSRGGNVVELAVGMRQQLVALLGGGVEAYGVVHHVVGGVRDLPICPVDAGGRGVDQVPDSGASSVVAVPARLQNVVEADDVALDVRVRVCDAVPYPRLCCKVDHDGRPELPEYAIHGIPVRDGLAEKGEPDPVLLQLFEPLMLEPDVVVVGDAVDADDAAVRAVVKQSFDEVRADKTGSTGHHHRGAGQSDVRL